MPEREHAERSVAVPHRAAPISNDDNMINVSILGSTGSIGTQTLDVIDDNDDADDNYNVTAIGAYRSVDQLAAQANKYHPDVVALGDDTLASDLAPQLPAGTELWTGQDALAKAATTADVVINGVVGFAGLPVTLAALQAGKRLGLANKESMVAAGPLVQQAAKTPGAQIIPVDSEHCAIHQCLRTGSPISGTTDQVSEPQVSEIVLTASGGPFRDYNAEQLQDITVADALAHPTWNMGPKITVDSSTLMNKGLEVIEAQQLFGTEFGVTYDQIRVVIHPQSIIHSMVTFNDAATIAQLSEPDMRLCIGYALAYPQRLNTPYGSIDWAKLTHLEFAEPDRANFACLDLAYAAGRAGHTAPAWLNAANEVAVQAFLDERISWVDIAAILEDVMSSCPNDPADSVPAVLDADAQARRVTQQLLDSRS